MSIPPKNSAATGKAFRATMLVLLMLFFTCACPAALVNVSATSIGIETNTLDLSLKYLQNGSRRQTQPSPLLINLSGTASASAYNRGCDGLAIRLGNAELRLMGCTTVIIR